MKILNIIILSCARNINILNIINKGLDDDLVIASLKGDTETVKLLLERGANFNDKNNDGYTALMVASSNRYEEVVKLLTGN